MGKAKTFEGDPCKDCGGTERYVRSRLRRMLSQSEKQGSFDEAYRAGPSQTP